MQRTGFKSGRKNEPPQGSYTTILERAPSHPGRQSLANRKGKRKQTFPNYIANLLHELDGDVGNYVVSCRFKVMNLVHKLVLIFLACRTCSCLLSYTS